MSPLPKTPSFRLDGRRALVTGAGRGIGRAAVAALAEAGAEVVAASRTAAELDTLCAEIAAAGGRATPLLLDLYDLPAATAAIAAQPAFDVFVNNAGTNRPAPFLEVKVEDFDAIVGLNLRSAFFAAQAVARGMVQAGRKGSIINLSSQLGHVGWQDRSVYAATKHAIEGLTKTMGAELAPLGIRVNSLCPTFIRTPLTEPFFRSDSFRRQVLAKMPMGRLGEVEELMGAILFLASDASALMTGSALMVDGGWTAV